MQRLHVEVSCSFQAGFTCFSFYPLSNLSDTEINFVIWLQRKFDYTKKKNVKGGIVFFLLWEMNENLLWTPNNKFLQTSRCLLMWLKKWNLYRNMVHLINIITIIIFGIFYFFCILHCILCSLIIVANLLRI